MDTRNEGSRKIPETWEELYASEHPIDFPEFLQSDVLAAFRNESRAISIIRCVNGSISALASAAIIWHILHTYKRLSTSYHRLIFCLCASDIISSMAHVLNATMIPKEMNYFIPFARGNTASCDFQGSLFIIGYGVSGWYNCSICFYYLAIVRYNKNDEFIRTKLEPWFHIVPILMAITFVVLLQSIEAFNTSTHIGCFIFSNRPPHCIGYEDGLILEGFTVPCGRGNQLEKPFGAAVRNMGQVTIFALPPITIIATMVLMYRHVHQIEKKIQTYSFRALVGARPTKQCPTKENSDATTSYNCKKLRAFCMRKKPLLCNSFFNCRKGPGTTSNQTATQKRAVLSMAVGYSLAWAFTHVPYMILLAANHRISSNFILAFFHPLQGLYNAIVFMSPKVRHIKNSKKNNFTWCQAFWKAWQSRGDQKKEDLRQGTINPRQHFFSKCLMSDRLCRYCSRSKSKTVPPTNIENDQKCRLGFGEANNEVSQNVEDIANRSIQEEFLRPSCDEEGGDKLEGPYHRDRLNATSTLSDKEYVYTF